MSRSRGSVNQATREDRLAVSLESAARLAGVSERRLKHWQEIGLAGPTVSRKLSERNTVRLYGFQDLLSLLVVRELLGQRLTTVHIRLVVERLKSSGYKRPLTELRFATQGSEIFFQHPNGTWEGDRRKGQIVIHQVLDLRPLTAQIWKSIDQPRQKEVIGRTEQRRRVQSSKRVFSGTRIPVE